MSKTNLPEHFIERVTKRASAEGKSDQTSAPGVDYSRDFLLKHGDEIVALKEAELALRRGLPHLYGMKWYPWARDFFESREKLNFLCAANQISKSSTQIRKAIDWATDVSKWDELWPGFPPPNQFRYLYPTSNQATIEFETKWQQFLPQGEYKTHEQYGWESEYKNKEIFAIHFKSGCSIYFKSYKQGLAALQTGTVYAVFLDEECPEDLWDELVFRKNAVNGYIHMVFTATIGQDLWRCTIEPKDRGEEKFAGAWKRQVSMYDCQFYVDGSPSHWTNERINQAIATCKSAQEVQRRVFGRFVKDSGLKYLMFNIEKHIKPFHPVPASWNYYVGADIGSGGEEAHPSAVTIVAVDPLYQKGRVIAVWRGDGIRTTAGDVYLKAEEMIKDLLITPSGKYYDWASAEFEQISSRNGGGWTAADKKHDTGEKIINVLFRNNMMLLYETTEVGKLAGELSSVTIEGPKNKKKDDASDSFRYAVTKIPWDWSIISGAPPTDEDATPEMRSAVERELDERRKAFETHAAAESDLQDEFNDWNELY